MIDPIDPNRNLGAAFSANDKESNIMPNKNLGRMIKTSRYFLEHNEMPKITKENLPSLSLSFTTDSNAKEVHGQLQSLAMSISDKMKGEGYPTIIDHDKMDDDFIIDMPRITADFDDQKKKATINIAMKNFNHEDKTEDIRGPSSKTPQKFIDKWKNKHEGKDFFEKDGSWWFTQDKEHTDVFSHLHNLLSSDKGRSYIGGKLIHDITKGFTLHQKNHEYENLVGKPTEEATESFECGCKQFETFVSQQLECVKLKAREGQDYGLLIDQPQISGKKIKGTLAYAGVSLNNRLYLPEELAKGHGMTVPLILNHASTSGAEEELHRLPSKFRQGLENGLEMKVGEVTLHWDAEKLTLFYEGYVEDDFFQKEVDDMEMAVSLGMYYDSDSPKVCDMECYTMIKGAEFHEVSLVYHPGFPIATIEANEALLKERSNESVDILAKDLLEADIKDLKDINLS